MSLIIYHKHCMDGFAAACVVAAFLKRRGEPFEVRAAQYSEPPPTDTEVAGRHLYIVDFSYPLSTMLALADCAADMVWCDHHASTQVFVEPLEKHPKVHVRWRHDACGALVAWRALHAGACPPTILEYVDDRDRWLWALPGSREVSAALFAKYVDANPAEAFEDFLSEYVDDLQTSGELLLAALRARVKRAVGRAYNATISGVDCMAVNQADDVSEVGEAICAAGAELAVMYWENADGSITHSLRSANGVVNCAELAKRYGGGGHVAAAGFKSTGVEAVRRPAKEG